MPMKISTLNYFIASVPSSCDNPVLCLEDISLLSFPEVIEYLDSQEEEVSESLVKNIIAKSKS
jgi:hypothetical protein